MSPPTFTEADPVRRDHHAVHHAARNADAFLSEHGVLCFGGEDWWYHNRGHCDMQLMRQYARCGRVVYVNSIVMRKPNLHEGTMFWRRLTRKARSIFRGLVRVADTFWVYSPATAPVHHLWWARAVNQRMLRAQARLVAQRVGLRRPLVWVNCPAACDTALALPRCALVYQRTDRFEEFPGVDGAQIAEYDRKLKQQADLTFFSNRTLYEEERHRCRTATYVDHGVDYEAFARAEQDPQVPSEMRDAAHPVVGFFGGIDSHTFDMPLAARIVEKLPDVTFVFLGKASIDCSPLTRHPNVLRIGQRPYQRIPHYGKCFDVCIMPWNRNRWIAACNPIKLKEYLALGKPVVSTPFPELAAYDGLVRTASGADEFAAAIRTALRDRSSASADARRRYVAAHTWQGKSRQILAALDI